MEALTIKNLKKTYEGNHEALKGIDLNVEEGDFFALLGPNGAGKTTTIGIISSLVNKTSGQVKILGIDIDQGHSLAKKQLGVVGQEINFHQFLDLKCQHKIGNLFHYLLCNSAILLKVFHNMLLKSLDKLLYVDFLLMEHILLILVDEQKP